MVGETLGSYKLVSKLGEGGMGVVYLAEHTLIGRKAAVKVLRSECTGNQEMVQRFFNEARSTAMIRHSGLIDVFDFGHHTTGSGAGAAYIVMEYLDGESLAARIERGVRFPVEIIVDLGRQIAAAVGAAHARGIVHRDLKPDNIFLLRDDVDGGFKVKVLDFGIAKLGDDATRSWRTKTGTVMGTPLYMSPEQCRDAGEVDARADVYSLGCILYEMACGRPPFDGATPADVLVAHLKGVLVPPRVRRPDLPRELDAVLQRALAREAGQRYQSMEELSRELERCGAGGRAVLPEAIPLPAAASAGAGQVRRQRVAALEDTAHAQPEGVPRTDLDAVGKHEERRKEAAGAGPAPAGPAAQGAVKRVEQPHAGVQRAGAAEAASEVDPELKRTTPYRRATTQSLLEAARGGRGWLVAALLGGVVIVGGVVWLSRGGPGRREPRPNGPAASARPAPAAAPNASATPTPSPTATSAPSPSPVASEAPVPSASPGADPADALTPRPSPSPVGAALPGPPKLRVKSKPKGELRVEDGVVDPFED
ncbi:MAG: protein kinase [Deltaproteobacteria bacterium]|nr:protein kinase [Deltaproteobacteria bacterium]